MKILKATEIVRNNTIEGCRLRNKTKRTVVRVDQTTSTTMKMKMKMHRMMGMNCRGKRVNIPLRMELYTVDNG